jgi:type III restriction enzyme
METGTGKTYVYLRSAFELNKKYGFTKFIVVVPSVAIREGVLSNLRLLQDHFKVLYDGVAYEYRVYDSKNAADLRSFAQSNKLQILVMNIDAFNKDKNLIYKGRDNTMGVAPIDYIKATNPILILDEPQNLSGDAAQAGLGNLNPLAIFRYSATHRETPSMIYRLTPVDAYEKKLVKRIEVWPVLADADLNKPYIEMVKVNTTKTTVNAYVVIDVKGEAGVVRKTVKLKKDMNGVLPDLFDLSGRRETYRGYGVEDIKTRPASVVFANGVVLKVGEKSGVNLDVLQRVAIETAVKQHLDMELELRAAYDDGRLKGQIKPLTLIFIDKVANYYPTDGKFRKWFTEAYTKQSKRSDLKILGLPDVSKVHAGYFAVSANGEAKDSKDNLTTESDVAAYELIMKRKDLLMSPDEPLRFIWSHSALREGWDNPNVFTIATLNETKSTMKKRQEIGRGLRLPVMSNGERCMDHELNRLTVVANESYDSFAEQLQHEIEADTSTTFAKGNIKNKRGGRKVSLKDSAKLDPAFKALWTVISAGTTYEVDYDTADLIKRAVVKMTEDPNERITATYVRVSPGALSMSEKDGVIGTAIPGSRAPHKVEQRHPIPDIVGRLADDVHLSRRTVAQILTQSGRLGEIAINPALFMQKAGKAIDDAMAEVMVAGIRYDRTANEQAEYAMTRLTTEEATAFSEIELSLEKSVMSEVVWDSDTEREFAEAVNNREDVKWFIKLPWWFKVETPVGNYNPDWAVCHMTDGGARCVYLVKETKGVKSWGDLHKSEQLKIQYGKKHFDALEVSYEWVKDGNYAVPQQLRDGERHTGSV